MQAEFIRTPLKIGMDDNVVASTRRGVSVCVFGSGGGDVMGPVVAACPRKKSEEVADVATTGGTLPHRNNENKEEKAAETDG